MRGITRPRGYELCNNTPDDTELHRRSRSLKVEERASFRWRFPLPYRSPSSVTLVTLVSVAGVFIFVKSSVSDKSLEEAFDLKSDVSGAVRTNIDNLATDYARKATILKLGRNNLTVGVFEGDCVKVNRKIPMVVSGRLDDALEHIICYTTARREFHVVADISRQPSDDGKFGFGSDISVSLRPDLETDAVWRMQAGAKSLGLELDVQKAFRIVGLRILVGEVIKDMPLVVVRPRMPNWPVDVAIADPSVGDCGPELTAKSLVFVCRAKVNPATRADIMAFCGSGPDYAMESRTWNSPTYSAAVASSSGLPWMRWSVQLPQEGAISKWRLSLYPRNQGQQGPIATPTELEIFVVSGTTDLPITLRFPGSLYIHAASIWIFRIAMLALLSAVVATVMSLFLLPGPVVGALPAANYAFTVLQILVFFGDAEHVPIQLRELQRDIACFSLRSPIYLLAVCANVISLVAVAHACCVMKFLASNGTGSGSYMPYSLLLGSWELRAVPFVALPLSAAGTALVINHFYFFTAEATHSSQGAAFVGVLIVVALLTISVYILFRVYSDVADERVIRVELPVTRDVIFTDRVGDQLRSMPMSASEMFGLDSWTTKPGFMCAPPIAAMREMHHVGNPPPRTGIGSPAIWANGPWETSAEDKSRLAHPAKSLGRFGESASKSSPPLLCSSISQGQENSKSVYADSLSVLAKEHVVSARVLFAQKACDPLIIAGLLCLPWVDVAVPATCLRLIWAVGADDNFTISGHVGQISGPITGGRLSACYEWTDRVPWRLPVDILIKVFLGVYFGSSPLMHGTSATWVLAAHWLAAVTMIVFALLALYSKPHHTWFENLSLSAVFVAASLLFLSAHVLPVKLEVTAITSIIFSVLTMVVLVPVLILICAAGLLGRATFQISSMKTAQDVLPLAIRDWDQSLTRANRRNYAMARLLPELTDGRTHIIDLPALTSAVPTHVQINGPATSSGFQVVRVENDVPTMFVPVDVLLSEACDRTHNIKLKQPFAALITSDGGVAAYSKPEFNAGRPWKDVVARFLSNHSAGLATAVLDAITHHSERSGDGSIVTIELVR